MGKVDLGTTKYAIHARIEASGIVEKPDVVGAIFGQTEGLLGDDLDLRELQKTGRIGRIEVQVESKGGKSKGTISVPSSLDKVETAILASALETINRVGPCEANITVESIEDVRVTKRKMVIDRAKDIIATMVEDITPDSIELTEEVKQSVRLHEIRKYGPDQLPAGPNIGESDAVIVVEGRADVLNLLRYGVKNAIAVEGTSVPKSIAELSKQKTVTVFTDGDRGGELILRELLQVAEVDFVARAPNGKEVEELTKKEVFKVLRNKIPVEQIQERFKLSEQKRSKIGDTDKKRERGREVRRGPYTKREKTEEKPAKAILPGPKATRYRELFSTLSGTLKAYLLDGDNEVIKEVAVRDLAMALTNSKEQVAAVLFDGVVTQRLVEIGGEKGIKFLVGAKIGTISKKPDRLNLLTSTDLGIEG